MNLAAFHIFVQKFLNPFSLPISKLISLEFDAIEKKVILNASVPYVECDEPYVFLFELYESV